eukprot:jgi/Galph1/1170/GphlegSOOS_G5914.1
MTEVVRKSRENNKGETGEERFFHSRSSEQRDKTVRVQVADQRQKGTYQRLVLLVFMRRFPIEYIRKLIFQAAILDSVFKQYLDNLHPIIRFPGRQDGIYIPLRLQMNDFDQRSLCGAFHSEKSGSENVYAIKCGRLPYIQEAVTVAEYLIGGGNISVTAGVVCRVELEQ